MGDTKATVNPGAGNRKWWLIQVWVKRKVSPGLGNTAATANAGTDDMEMAIGPGMGDTKETVQVQVIMEATVNPGGGDKTVNPGTGDVKATANAGLGNATTATVHAGTADTEVTAHLSTGSNTDI